MAWNLSSLSPNMMELTNILMKMIQETTDFSNAFNVTSFSSVLQRLEVMMTQQLGTKLTEWYVNKFWFFSYFEIITIQPQQTRVEGVYIKQLVHLSGTTHMVFVQYQIMICPKSFPHRYVSLNLEIFTSTIWTMSVQLFLQCLLELNVSWPVLIS